MFCLWGNEMGGRNGTCVPFLFREMAEVGSEGELTGVSPLPAGSHSLQSFLSIWVAPFVWWRRQKGNKKSEAEGEEMKRVLPSRWLARWDQVWNLGFAVKDLKMDVFETQFCFRSRWLADWYKIVSTPKWLTYCLPFHTSAMCFFGSGRVWGPGYVLFDWVLSFLSS